MMKTFQGLHITGWGGGGGGVRLRRTGGTGTPQKGPAGGGVDEITLA